MSQFFLELFSEEIPATLQKNARENILKLFKDNFGKNNIIYKSGISYSTPNRLVFIFEGIPIKIHEKALKIKGPRTDAPKQALEGFIKSNNLDKKNMEKASESGLTDSEILDGFNEIKSGESGRMSERKHKESNQQD